MLRKKILISSVIIVIIAVFCGCFLKKEPNILEAENKVVLKWVIGGQEEQRDSELVYKKFNEELQKYLPGTTVEFECYSSKEYAEKWKMISISQEEFDIVWTGYSLDFYTEVKKGSYMPLNDLIDTYAPDIKKEISQDMLKKQTINGQIYSIPCMQQMVSYVSTMGIDSKTYEKYRNYIDPEELGNFFSSHKKMDKECWNTVEKYVKMFYDNGDLPDGVAGFESHAEKGYEWVRNPYKIEDYGDNYTPINYYRTPEYKLFVDTYSAWYKKGYIRQDVLKTDKGNTAVYNIKGLGNYLAGQGYMPTESSSEGNQTYVQIPFCDEHYIPFSAAATSTAISAECKHPDRAIKLIELMNTKKGKELYNLLVYGIEGKHYSKLDDGRIIPIGYVNNAPVANTPYGQFKWAVGNTFNAYEIYSATPNPILQNKFIEKVNNEARVSKLMGFTLDIEPIKNELKQIDAVVGEYAGILKTGAAEDPQTMYNVFVEKLIRAGDDKVIAEITRQIDEWRSSKEE